MQTDSSSPPLGPAPAAVMFSGGTDSTLAAALMLEEGREVHLLTFNPGFVLFLDHARRNARRLQQVYGASRVAHHMLDNREITRQILWQGLGTDLVTYGFNMNALVCLGCRMAMHTGAIIHCLLHQVPYLVDGSIAGQATIPEQLRSTLERHRAFYQETFAILHRSPIYDDNIPSDCRLSRMGLGGQQDLKRQFILFDTQGTCPLGVTADVYARIFYRLMPETRERESEAYGRARYPRMIQLVRGGLAQKGIDLQAAVQRLVGRVRAEQDHVRDGSPDRAAGEGRDT